MRLLFLWLLLSCSLLAADDAAQARAAAGCGPDEVHFKVKTDKNKHPLVDPQPGKANVYVIARVLPDGVIRFGGPLLRVGVDAGWVGADRGNSYFYFAIDPGDHRVCTQIQSLSKAMSKVSGATHLTAEAGQSYYLEAKVVEPTEHPGVFIKLEPLDSAQGQVMIASSALSTSTRH